MSCVYLEKRKHQTQTDGPLLLEYWQPNFNPLYRSPWTNFSFIEDKHLNINTLHLWYTNILRGEYWERRGFTPLQRTKLLLNETTSRIQSMKPWTYKMSSVSSITKLVTSRGQTVKVWLYPWVWPYTQVLIPCLTCENWILSVYTPRFQISLFEVKYLPKTRKTP